MKKKLPWILTGWMSLALVFAMGQMAFGQLHSMDIGVGSLRITLNEALAGGNQRLVYPRQFNVYKNQSCVEGEGIIIGAKDFRAKAYYEDGFPNPQKPNKGWVVGDSLFHYYVVDATPRINVDIEHTTIPVTGALKRFWKYPAPTRIVNEEDLSASDWDPYYEEVRESIPTEQMGVAVCRTSMGITVTERAYVFGNPGYDDFAIVEYIFKYTGVTGNVDNQGNPITYSDPIKDCYLGIKFWPVISDTRVVPNSGGWKESTDDWVDYTYAEDGDTLRVMYAWDGDAGSTPEDDEGDPLVYSSGVFLSSHYPGMAVLHVDKATDDPTNDISQPHLSYVSWGAIGSTNTLTTSPNGPGMEEVYHILENGGNLTPPLDWAKWKSTRTEDWLRGTNDPTDQYNQIGTLAFGPYEFNNADPENGDSVRIVICYAVGTIGWKKAIELGVEWRDGKIERTQKNWVLRSGRDSLFARLKAVKKLFEKMDGRYDFTIQTIAEKIQAPPQWPDSLVLSSEVGGCGVKWSPIEGAVAYRVYRRLQPEFFVETPGTETYPLVFQCGGDDPGGGAEYSPTVVTSWIDKKVVPAQHYWYYVTAINAEGVESSHFVTRTNPRSEDPLYGSVTPFEESPRTLDSVYVVPNPYHVKAVRLYYRPLNRLDFVGLPAACRIRIFTQSGDLIATIKHEWEFPPSSTEAWEMMTSMNQTIASGLYIYVVDQCRDYENKEINQTKVGKFVVIR